MLPTSPRPTRTVLLVLGLLACAACGPAREDLVFVPPDDVEGRWLIIDTQGLTVATSTSSALDHTTMFVSAGATFGNLTSSGEAPVTPSSIEAKAWSSPWNMLDLKVYAGSGDGYPPSTQDQQEIAHFVPSNSIEEKQVLIDSFSFVPNYKASDGGYWLWVVIEVKHETDAGDSRLYNARRFMSVMGPKSPTEFVDNSFDLP